MKVEDEIYFILDSKKHTITHSFGLYITHQKYYTNNNNGTSLILWKCVFNTFEKLKGLTLQLGFKIMR
jgi:hypothetical protein